MSYGNPYQNNNPYGQGPAAESGYGSHGRGQEQYEMQSYGQQQQPQQQGTPPLSLNDYLSRVAHVRKDIRTLTTDVQTIASLHQRALAGNDPGADAELSNRVASTQLKNTSIRDQIRLLKIDCERTTDGTLAVKKRQFDALQGDFRKELQGYLQEEQQYKERYRDQIARQYRIVNPDASEDEVRRAADADWGNEGVFQQALRTNRHGQANAVLGAVRARHNELLRIEQSIAELAGMFQDLDTLVVLQEATVVRAEDQVEQTNQHLQKGNEQVGTAVVHARKRRKYFWWCFFVGVLIVLAIGLGVGLGIYFTQHSPGSGSGH